MNKTQLITKVAEVAEVTKIEAGKYVDSVFEAIRLALVEGEDVKLVGLIDFKVKDVPAKPEKQGRNPQTGEAITIAAKPATRKVTAKAGKVLQEAVK